MKAETDHVAEAVLAAIGEAPASVTDLARRTELDSHVVALALYRLEGAGRVRPGPWRSCFRLWSKA